MEISVKNLRVLIAATASGIGCAVAKSFLDNGARVHVCDINEDQLDACTTSLPGAGVTRANVAGMILFLCSAAGSKITGLALSVDGFTETLRG